MSYKLNVSDLKHFMLYSVFAPCQMLVLEDFSSWLREPTKVPFLRVIQVILSSTSLHMLIYDLLSLMIRPQGSEPKFSCRILYSPLYFKYLTEQ